jgi:hypothetical protein
MNLSVLTQVLQVINVICAVVLARRSREYRPIAVFLCGVTCADLLSMALAAWVLPPPPQELPLSGFARLAAHIDCALFLMWPAWLAETALAVFMKRRAWPVVALLWAVMVAALVLTYPATRGIVLQRWFLAAELVALMVTLGAIIQWAWHTHELPRVQHIALMLIFGVDVASLIAGPWRTVIYEAWPLAQFMSAVLYALLITLQGRMAWTSASRPSS